jgi:hypothetical protein
MPGRWLSVAVAGLTIAVSAGARAADTREAREREARKACFTGNVDRGVEILVDLYGETGHPNYIYNQARCFERNGKYDQALLSYEDYLRKATNVGDDERAQVEKSMTELRAKVAAAPAAGATAPQLLSPALDAPEPPGAPKAPESPPLAAGSRDTAADGLWPWPRKAGVMSLVVAGGSLAVGVAGTVLRHGRGDEFNDVCTLDGGQPVPRVIGTGPDCRGKYDAVKGAERMMWIGYVGAGAFAAAGTALLLLAPPSGSNASGAMASACLPMLGDNAGVACAWRF